jgi:hypothetical protein
VALAQLAAVRHSGSKGPVAGAAIEELCRAASGAEGAVRAALVGMPAGGQLGSAAAAAVIMRLECLEAALDVALPARMAIGIQLVPLVYSVSQLAVTVLQCTALQVHSLPDVKGCGCQLAPFVLQHPPATGSTAVGKQNIQLSLVCVLLPCRNTLLSSLQQCVFASRLHAPAAACQHLHSLPWRLCFAMQRCAVPVTGAWDCCGNEL